MDGRRWGDYYEMGVYLFVAHHLTLFGGRRRGAGGKSTSGLISSKSVGGVSASYDTTSTGMDGAGQWNATNFGKRWMELAELVGMGGVQVGAGPLPPTSGMGGFTPI
jgi:hypothetical protein